MRDRALADSLAAPYEDEAEWVAPGDASGFHAALVDEPADDEAEHFARLDQVCGELHAELRGKTHSGQRKHGGDVTRKPMLYQARDESLDMAFYLHVLCRQHEEAIALLRSGRVEQALNILEHGNVEGEAEEERASLPPRRWAGNG